MKRNLPVLLLLVLVGVFAASSSSKDKKDLQLTKGDVPRQLRFCSLSWPLDRNPPKPL